VRVEVRFYGPLVDLAEQPEVVAPFGEPRSVKDLIEALGVPHPEIGLLLVDGAAVGFDHLLRGGERVAVYPPWRSVPLAEAQRLEPSALPPRFVLDVHLGTLARRLRLLGFDCWYRTDADDATLADVTVAERRILLTRDRGLLMRRVITHGYCPRSDDPDRQLDEVAERYDLAERLAPLTRCVACNGELSEVEAGEVAAQVPPLTRAHVDRFARCEACGQVFWPGAHRGALTDIIERVRAGR
jgi:uncharacterized protein